MHHLIADITRADPGTEQNLVEQAQAAFPASTHASVLLVRREDQSIRKPDAWDEAVLPRSVHYSAVLSLVSGRTLAWLDQASEGFVHIVTKHRTVFEFAENLSPERRSRVRTRPYSSLRRFEEKAAESAWPSDVMPVAQALALLRDTLAVHHATSRERGIRKSLLRAFMGARDKRFRKPHPLASAHGVITALVVIARAKGIIELDDDANPSVWLTELAAKQASPQPVGKDSRSQQYINILKDEGLGPFASIRGELFDALERGVADAAVAGAPLSAARAIRHAVDRTRDSLRDTNRSEDYPWTAVRDFLSNLLSRSEVLVTSEDTAFALSWRTLNTPVCRLRQDWRRLLENEMVTAILARSDVEVTLSDAPRLAGALFFTRDDDAVDRVNDLIVWLLNNGRAVEGDPPLRRLTLPELAG